MQFRNESILFIKTYKSPVRQMCLQMATEIIVNVESVFFLFQTFSYIQKGIHLIPNSLLPPQLH